MDSACPLDLRDARNLFVRRRLTYPGVSPNFGVTCSTYGTRSMISDSGGNQQSQRGMLLRAQPLPRSSTAILSCWIVSPRQDLHRVAHPLPLTRCSQTTSVMKNKLLPIHELPPSQSSSRRSSINIYQPFLFSSCLHLTQLLPHQTACPSLLRKSRVGFVRNL
jgi:hypothetical protein